MPNKPTFLIKSDLVGREAELAHLTALLNRRGENHFVYYYAQGGYGKTRVLEELQEIVKQHGSTFRATGIIDLYHTDTHSASDIEKATVEGLDPNNEYFRNYRSKREDYELLRERGADPGLLEKKREELGRTLVEDWVKPAVEAAKLVICFDTVELLQYESSVVEETIGEFTVDTRVREWLLDKLPKLRNVLVVFAGRPKQRSSEETTDHQERLLSDMRKAFGDNFDARELSPLDQEETKALVRELTQQIERRAIQADSRSDGQKEIVPAKYLQLIHQLTAGRPIYVHLIVDLLGGLSPEPRAILEQLDGYVDLEDVQEDDPRLETARRAIEAAILDAVYNHAGELGGYISRIALMPKGVDAEILSHSLGLPLEEAQDTLEQLATLSFVKRYATLRGAQMLHGDRLFLHDEMYQLLSPIPYRRITERHVAQGLIENHYDPKIESLEAEIGDLRHNGDDKDTAQRRVWLRERLQKLQVERLYYQMVRDPRRAYGEYKDLSDQANRHRWVGFGMRLLDEFLRFYNTAERRRQFEASGITHEQVIRESAELWVERFYWWGQKQRCVRLAEMIMDAPQRFQIRDDDLALLGNICARWVDVKADLSGYDASVVDRANAYLTRIGKEPATPEATLASARLNTSIGYQLRKGGQLRQATKSYVAGNTAYRRLERYKDELAILLNNLAYANARQGRFHLARPLVSEALRINEDLGNDYTTGLTLSTFAAIEVLRGRFDAAIDKGKDARERFQRMQDPHGIVLAYLSLARAERKKAKESIEKKRKLPEARSLLETARDYLRNALEETDRSGLDDDRRLVYAELGRVLREMGKVATAMRQYKESKDYFQASKEHLDEALRGDQTSLDRADILEDIAELHAVQGAYESAYKSLQQVEEALAPQAAEEPGHVAQNTHLPSEYYLPLGKAERLRGKIEFDKGDEGDFAQALQHFVKAYAYFHRFSTETPEKDPMTDLVYDNLTRLDIETQSQLVTTTREWADAQPFSDDVKGLTETLRDLTGV
jgi:tetratricopeptide (TPR) repeat protein